MFFVKNLLFLVTAATALITPEVERRNAAQTQQDLTNINGLTITFTQKIDSYAGGLTILDVGVASINLNSAITQATTNAQNSATVATDAEARNIIAYINDTLFPNVQASLTALKNKRDRFRADGHISTIKSRLTTSKTNNINLGAALLKNTPPSEAANANAAQARINAAFDDAIAFYNL